MYAAATIEDLRKDYRLGAETVHALRGVSLELAEGEHVAIMGPSGSGKTTLLNVLGCLDRPTGGRYLLAGVDVTTLDDDSLSEIRSAHIGFVFQSYNLVSELTLLENIELPLYYRGRISDGERRRCRELAGMVGLGDRLHHRPTQLSGGQQQRAAIARSLANDPTIVLADEPTGNLDTATSEEILALLDTLVASGKTLVIVTHEPDVARRAQRAVTLRDGRIASDERTVAAAAGPLG